MRITTKLIEVVDYTAFKHINYIFFPLKIIFTFIGRLVFAF